MFLQLQQQALLLGRKPLGFTEHYYTEWDDGLGKEKIALFLLISVSNTQIPSSEIAKEAFQLLQDHFLDDLAGDPYDRFENALREINHMVSQKEKELDVKFIPNLHTVVGVIQKDLLFLSQRGEAQGYLLRKRHVSSITEGLFDEKNKEDLFQNIASGVLEVGDDVLFVTGPLIQYVTPNDLAKIFSEQSLAQASKELGELLKGDIEDQLALLAFEVLEKTEEFVPHALKSEEEEPVMKREHHGLASIEEEEEELSPRRARLNQALARLRGFALNNERFAFLDRIRRWEKKKLLKAIVALAVLIVGGIFVLSVTLGEQRKIDAMQARLDEAQASIAQAQTKGSFDKAEASILLDGAEALAAEVLESGYLGSQVSDILDQIAEEKDDLDTVRRVSSADLQLVADLSGKLIAGEKIQGVDLLNDQWILYTAQNAYPVLTDQVQSPDVLTTEGQVVEASRFVDYSTLLLLTSNAKLVEYTDGNAQFADTADVQWKTGTGLATYSNKVYILDAVAQQIWKYQRGNSGYSGAQGYLPEVDGQLSTAVSIAVDGKVWVLLKDGTLLQYFAGDAVDYNVKKAPVTPFEGVTQVYTHLDMTQLYIVDAAAQRIFVYDKSSKTDDLTYSSQYAFDDLDGTVTGLYVDNATKALMITTETALYKVGLVGR